MQNKPNVLIIFRNKKYITYVLALVSTSKSVTSNLPLVKKPKHLQDKSVMENAMFGYGAFIIELITEAEFHEIFLPPVTHKTCEPVENNSTLQENDSIKTHG